MIGGTRRERSILALLLALGIGAASCATSVEGDPTPVTGQPVGDDDLGGATDGLGGSCDEGSCSVYEQCGCDPGQACDLDGAALDVGGTECRAVTSPGQTQSNCSAAEECAAGYSCLGDPGQCRKMCDEDDDCGAGYCIVQVVFESDEGVLESVPDAAACTKQCAAESADQSGCPRDPPTGCRFYPYETEPGALVHLTDCTEAGAGTDEADCAANGDADCAPGFGCYLITFDDDSEASQCRQICAFPAGGDEADGVCGVGTCHRFDPPAVVGEVEYGGCF